jgi:hypothetical protein
VQEDSLVDSCGLHNQSLQSLMNAYGQEWMSFGQKQHYVKNASRNQHSWKNHRQIDSHCLVPLLPRMSLFPGEGKEN